MFLESYFPVLLFILVGILVGIVPMLLGRALGPHKPDPQKLSPYECGFEAFVFRTTDEPSRMKDAQGSSVDFDTQLLVHRRESEKWYVGRHEACTMARKVS